MGQPNACIFNSPCMHVPLQPEFGRMPLRFFLCAAYWFLILILSPCYCQAHWKWKVGPRKLRRKFSWNVQNFKCQERQVGISPLLRRVKPGHPPAMYVVNRRWWQHGALAFGKMESWNAGACRDPDSRYFDRCYPLQLASFGSLILVDRTCPSLSLTSVSLSISSVVRISAVFCSSYTILLQWMAGRTTTGSDSTNPLGTCVN
jgi:hypothetical protein